MESPQRAASLSRASLTCLSRAGWHAGRRIDPAPLVEANARAGIETPVAAREFYSSVGELDVRYPLRSSRDHQVFFRVSAEYAEHPNSLYGAARFGAVVGSPLTVVGMADSEHVNMFMSRVGAVYCACYGRLFDFGRSWSEAVNCLCEGRDGVEIPVPSKEIPVPDGTRVLSRESIQMIRIASPPLDVLTADLLGTFRLDVERLPIFPKELRIPLGMGYYGDRGVLALSRHANAPRTAITIWEKELRSRVETIGKFTNSGSIVIAAADGRVYSALPECPVDLLFLGASLSDAINRLAPGGEGAIQM